jgi:dGTPase
MEWDNLLSTERLMRGATTPDKTHDRRSPFQRDFDRVAYSTPFRRLQNKTQVHTLPNNDHVRNRLTHSLEASTLARSLGNDVGHWLVQTQGLKVSAEALAACAQAATLAHDIGNPPFGHPGEAAIRDWFDEEKAKPNSLKLSPAEIRDFTTFNGNAQGFRILTQYVHGHDTPGLQLTCATLAAFSKYPMATSAELPGRFKDVGVFSNAEATFALVAERTGLLKSAQGTWARHPLAYLVEAADDIAYLTADIEDGVELGMITSEEATAVFRDLIADDKTPVAACVTRLRSILIGKLMDYVVNEFKRDYDCIMSGQREESLLKSHRARGRLKELAQRKIFASAPQIRRDVAGKEALDGLLKRLATTVCAFKECSWSLDKLKGEDPHKWRLLRLIESSGADGEQLSKLDPATPDVDVLHQIVDYIAGQTDRYAIELWQNVRGIEL